MIYLFLFYCVNNEMETCSLGAEECQNKNEDFISEGVVEQVCCYDSA